MSAAAGVASAEQIVWEMDYTRLHFDWNGTWDKTAWWSYAMWYLDLFDWSYLWAWYGLGWDQLSPLNTPPSGKIDIWFYESQWGGQSDGQNVYLAINNMQTLDISTTQWFYQTLSYGSLVTHELSHSIFYFQANGFHYYDDHHVTTEALAYYTGNFIYPWYSYYSGSWHCAKTFSSLSASYKSYVASDSNTYLSWMDAGYRYLYETQGTAKWYNAYYTMQAVGYYMYNYSGSQNTTPISNVVKALGMGATITSAYLTAFGHGIDVNTANYSNSSDFYYYFYHYYWG